MTLFGKGYYIWQIRNCEGGDANTIADLAEQSGYSHILIKIADGASAYNVDLSTGVDLVQPVAQALRSKGISPWGWHFLYGSNPSREADVAIQRLKQLDLDGYVLDAETQYEQPGKDQAAKTFMNNLRNALPSFPFALSSFRFPTFHPGLPWVEFLDKCDYNMPQVYWLKGHNPDQQLTRCVNEFQAIQPFRPIIPTGAAFTEYGWSPTPAEVTEFFQTARKLNLEAANFWEWSNTRRYLPEVWTTIQNYSWLSEPVLDITQRWLLAMNSHDPNQVASLYNPDAVYVTGEQTIKGIQAIRTWYSNLFFQLPNAFFTLKSSSGSANRRHFVWKANSSQGNINEGNDTLGLFSGQIVYHYTFFQII